MSSKDATHDRTLLQEHRAQRDDRALALRWRLEDGLILGSAKLVLRCPPFFHWHCDAFLWCAIHLARLAHLTKRSYSEKGASLRYKMFVDAYHLWAAALLVAAYLVVFLTWDDNSSCAAWARVLAVGFSTIRILENFSVILQLHAGHRRYETNTPARAVLLGLFVYLQNIVAFATLFLSTAFWTNDSYSSTAGDCIQKEWANGLYFSFVTTTTLGYGDYAPTRLLGKALVVAAVFAGIIVLVVALQRAVTASMERRSQE